VGVFGEKKTDLEFCDEQTNLDNERHLVTSGYGGSKWVSEKLMQHAKNRNVPVNIYRLGLITGDSEKGRYDPSQWFFKLIKSCWQLGLVFSGFPGFRIQPTPVDFTVRAMVILALKQEYLNGIYHICNPMVVKVEDLLKLYSDDKLRTVSMSDWITAAKTFMNRGKELALQAYIFELLDLDPGEQMQEIKALKLMRYMDSKKTIKILSKKGVDFPNIDSRLIQTYFQYVANKDLEKIL
jgi:thioester reductase-like protein